MREENLQIKVERNTILIPIICVVLGILVFIDPYKGWTILFFGLTGAWFLSYFWMRSLSTGIRLKREMRFGWAQVGDQLEERFTLHNRSLFPAFWIEIIDQTDMPDYQAIQIRGIGQNAETRWFIRSTCTRRGLYTFGPTTLRIKDPFGFFTLTVQEMMSTTMLVVPPIVSLPDIGVAPGGRAGEGPPRIDALEKLVSTSNVREYYPGESLRWIHWPTTARKRELYMRVFEGAPVGDWWIILDLDEQVQVGQGLESTLEHGIILAASLANLGMQSGRSVGLITHGDKLVWLPPNMSDEQNWSIVKELALISPGEKNLANVLRFSRSSIEKDTSLIIITPSVFDDWIEPLIAFRNQQVIPTILLFNPISFGGHRKTTDITYTLVKLGFMTTTISSDFLDQEQIKPGRKGSWDWKISPLGRAVPSMEPDELVWRNFI